MPTPAPMSDPAANPSKAEASGGFPSVALFPLGQVVPIDTPGSIGENTGPTTGQISPRF